MMTEAAVVAVLHTAQCNKLQLALQQTRPHYQLMGFQYSKSKCELTRHDHRHASTIFTLHASLSSLKSTWLLTKLTPQGVVLYFILFCFNLFYFVLFYFIVVYYTLFYFLFFSFHCMCCFSLPGSGVCCLVVLMRWWVACRTPTHSSSYPNSRGPSTSGNSTT